MRINSIKTKLLLSFMAFAAAFTLSACGAEVESIITVDGEFSGTRKITVTVDDYDMEDYVIGGADAMEEVFEDNLPSGMTMTRREGIGETIFTFKIEFDSLEEYTQKVTAVLAKNPDYEGTPEVKFEYVENPFKSSLSAEENFSTDDLIGWAVDALDDEGIITYSTKSSWYSVYYNTFELDGENPTLYQGYMDVSESEYTTFDSIDVVTELNYDGTYTRKIVFEISNITIAKLDGKNVDVEEYLTELAEEGTEGTEISAPVTVTAEDNKKIYTVEFTSGSAEDIAKITSSLLDTECTFSVDMTADELSDNVVNIDIDECISGISYFSKSDYSNKIRSRFVLYPGAVFDVDNSGSYVSEKTDEEDNCYFEYTPFGEDAQFSFDWAVTFDKIVMNLVVDKAKIAHDVTFTLSDELPEIVRTVAKTGLENSIPEEKAKFEYKSEEGVTTYHVSFLKDDIDEVVKRINYFISAYTKEDSTACVSIVPDEEKTTGFTKYYNISADISYENFASDEGEYTSVISGDSAFVEFAPINPMSTEETVKTIEYTDMENAGIVYSGIMKVSNIGLIGLIALFVVIIVVIVVVVMLLVTRNKNNAAVVVEGTPVDVVEALPEATVVPAITENVAIPVEETVAEEAPVEAPAEETVAEETPAEETTEEKAEETV